MRNAIFHLALAATFLAGTAMVHHADAQYYDNRVLDKSFERADFFFTPGFVNPYGLDGFGPAVTGLVQDPILDLRLSPSFAGADSAEGILAYLDFRNTTQRTRNYDYFYPALYELDYAAGGEIASRDAGFSYPGYYVESYRAVEPTLSTALFFRPAAARLPNLTIGATYRVLADDQGYYAVPQEVYRSNPGLDFAGAEATDGSVPITDIYSGSDQMNQIGHFPTVFAGYQLSPRWRAGVSAAFADFSRDGELGNMNSGYGYGGGSGSQSSNLESRNQQYNHTDLTLGLTGIARPGVLVGGSIGRLTGTADQAQINDSRNRYDYDYPQDQYESTYRSDASNVSDWDRSGTTWHGALFVRRQLDSNRLVSLTYTGMRQRQDLTSASAITDSSYSFNSNSNTVYTYRSEYESSLIDTRSGTGETSGTQHRIAAGFEWTLTDRTRLTMGLVGSQDRSETTSAESVQSSRYRFQDYEYQQERTVFEERINEEKVMNWTFTSRESALQIPIMVWQELSDHFQLLVGVTRRMENWRLEDETLALFDFRSVVRNGATDRETDFGERYREPTEFRTRVSTTGIFGITARPAPNLEIRLLAAPQWSDSYDTRRTQWWLGFELRP